jgi:tetratricopeptide (TPR) repeat protein
LRTSGPTLARSRERSCNPLAAAAIPSGYRAHPTSQQLGATAAVVPFSPRSSDDRACRAKHLRQIAVNLARRALEAAGDDAEVLDDVAYVLEYFETEIDPATCLIDRALKLSPSYAISCTRSGWLRLWAGHPDFALEHFEASLCLNPMRRAPASFGIAVAHFFARRLEKAAAMLFLSMQERAFGTAGGCAVGCGKLRHIMPVLVQARSIGGSKRIGTFIWRDCAWPLASWQGWISLMEW